MLRVAAAIVLFTAGSVSAGERLDWAMGAKGPVVTEHSCRCISCQCADCGKEPCPAPVRIQPTVTREYAPPLSKGGMPQRAEPPLRAQIAGYRASGGGRAYVRGESDREHLMREHGYQAWQLDGLTTDELQLLHGWVHRSARPTTHTIAQPSYQPAYAPRVWNAAPAWAGFSGSGCVGGG